MANQRLYGHWNHVTEALRTGLPQNESRSGGVPVFEAIYADPARLKSFLAAMTGISHGANMAIASKFPWSRYKTFADAGAAQGDLATQIALANPHLLGIGFDLAEVGPIFEEYVKKNGVADRVRFVAGSFFEQPLPN
jgi:O-methyltransferase domain